jgi:hypothetical protein
MKTLGWILFIFNNIGLFVCVYTLQAKYDIAYLSITGLLIAQIVYIAKTLNFLQRYAVTRERLEFTLKRARLRMIKILSWENTSKRKEIILKY